MYARTDAAAAAASFSDIEVGNGSMQGLETLAHLHAHLHSIGMTSSSSNGSSSQAIASQRTRETPSLRRKRQLPNPHATILPSVSPTPRTSLDVDSPRSGSGSDSESVIAPRSTSPDSNSASGSEQGNSCPNTPSMHAGLALAGPDASSRKRAAIVATDDTLEAEIQLRSSELDLPSYDAIINPAQPPALTIRISTASTLPLGRTSLTSEEDIRALSAHSSWYSQPEAEEPDVVDQESNRLSRLSRLSEFDSARASVQTYGSSVLTYGSRMSRCMSDTEAAQGEESESQHPPRPNAPLPWDPRPSALERINGSSNSRKGNVRRPLPPIPAPGLLAPSALPTSTENVDTEGASSSSTTKTIPARRPRPLPKTPSLMGSLSDIAEDTEGSVTDNASVSRPASMFSPSAEDSFFAPAGGPRARRFSNESFFLGAADDSILDLETISGSRTPGSRRTSWNARARRRASRASVRSTASGGAYLVPDVDELVRILDAMDVDGSGNSNGSFSRRATIMRTPISPSPAKRSKRVHHVRADTEEIDAFGSALARSQAASFGNKTSSDMAQENGSERTTPLVTVTGLPTPAATPKTSPERGAHPLPTAAPKTATLQAPPSSQSSSSVYPSSQLASPSLTNMNVSSFTNSPAPSVLSLSGFPLPPEALAIPGPSSLEVGEMPIPGSASSAPRSPGAAWALDRSRSLAERATLPGLEAFLAGVAPKTPPPPPAQALPLNSTPPLRTSPPKSKASQTQTRDAIADLRNRVAVLNISSTSNGVPILSQPVPPNRRRAQSSASGALESADVNPVAKTLPVTQSRRPPAIDVKAANTKRSVATEYGIGEPAGSGASSAPLFGSAAATRPPTIVYATPNVAPLRLRKTSNASLLDVAYVGNGAKPVLNAMGAPPPAEVPQSARAANQAFPRSGPSPEKRDGARQYRTTSLCSVSPTNTTAPLRFRNSRVMGVTRSRSATLDMGVVLESNSGSAPSAFAQRRKNSNASNTMSLRTPTTATRIQTAASIKSSPTKTIVPDRQRESDATIKVKVPSPLTPPDNPAPALEHSVFGFGGVGSSSSPFGASYDNIDDENSPETGTGTGSFDPAFQNMISTIAGASEEEQMGSLLTIASSINTEVHYGSLGLGLSGMDSGSFMLMSSDEGNSDTSTSKRPHDRSETRVRTNSAAAKVRAAIQALPDPNTFPMPSVPPPMSGGTDGGADYTTFGAIDNSSGSVGRSAQPPQLRVVTKFRNGNGGPLPASQAPASATSTKSMASTFSSAGVSKFGMNGYGSNASRNGTLKSRVAGPRKMNRLTLTDPRSPMADAAVAAAQLVARVREKRAALAQRGVRVPGAPVPSNASNSNSGEDAKRKAGARGMAGHKRTGSNGSNGTLRSKLKMSGGGFFGSGPTAVKSSPKKSLLALPDIDIGLGFDSLKVDTDTDIQMHNGPRRRITKVVHRPERGSLMGIIPSHVQ